MVRGTKSAIPAGVKRWGRVVASAASLGLAVWLLVAVVPMVSGVGWEAIVAVLRQVGLLTALGLAIVWLAGLWSYTYVLTGSLPGLRNGQAFSLNAAGSAVSNLFPFGGAAGVAITVVMASSWGHSGRAIAASALVSGVWNAAARIAPVLLAAGISGSVIFSRDVLVIVIASTAAIALIAVVLYWAWRPKWLGVKASEFLTKFRDETKIVIRHGWRQMTFGMLAYLVLQCVLLWCCLGATGVWLGAGALIAAFAVSRLLTLVVITPGGFGVSESGTIALLVSLDIPAAPAAAGVLLFAVFTFLAEIPLGGLAWVNWLVRGRSG